MLGPQQPQGIVLLGGEVVLAKEGIFQGLEAVVAAPQVQEGLLLERVEAAQACGGGRYCDRGAILSLW